MGDGGGEASFDSFFNHSWPRLQAQAYVLTGSHEQAQDLTQEALLPAWREWERVSTLDSPEAWTRKVLDNLCIASWRATRRRRTKHDVPVHAEIPDSHSEIAQAMRSLPGNQARTLLLHDGLGMTSADVALELGVPDGTVKSWLSRSRKVVAGRPQQIDNDPSWR